MKKWPVELQFHKNDSKCRKACCSTQNALVLHIILESLSTVQVLDLMTNLPVGKMNNAFKKKCNNQEMCLLGYKNSVL